MYVNKFIFSNQSESNSSRSHYSLGEDYQKRSYQQNFDESSPVTSASRKQFDSIELIEEKQSSEFLINRLNPNRENKKAFDFHEIIKEIHSDGSLKDLDKELAETFRHIVNPGRIPDGHCAKCAFNTMIHFSGMELKEAEEIDSDVFFRFSHWFYKRFSPDIVDPEMDIVGKEGETFANFRERVRENVKAVTKAGEGVLISIGSGTHWFTAFNDGERVWFIDSQLGEGFNLHRGEAVKDEVVSIVKMSHEQIDEYNTSIA